MTSFHFSLLFLVFLVNLVTAEIVLEDGYSVITVFDGNKRDINPHAVVARPRSSDLIILDSSSSTFYIVSLPLSQESVVKRLSGDGFPGYSDGESDHARFKKPRSFAVDAKGNVYVADKNNYAIRKISNPGTVTTIAGGYSKKEGREDGPAQNASFSSDFELAFVPERCVLLVSDHGNQLVRQINLKVQDCARSSRSVVGAVSVWTIGLGLSCLLGVAIGIAVHPYVIHRECCSLLHFSGTWKHCLINLGKQVLILCFDIRSAAAKSMAYSLLSRLYWLSLSHLSLMFRVNNVDSRTATKNLLSLVDSDDLNSHEVMSSQMIIDQLKDLLSSDGSLELPNTSYEIIKQGDVEREKSDVLYHGDRRIDHIIQANIKGFAKAAIETTPPVESFLGSSSLVKRR